MKFKNILFIGIIIQGLVACDKVDSDLVSPESIYFSTNIEQNDELIQDANTITCITSPYHQASGPSKLVDLIDGDKLTCNGVRMRRKDNVLGFTYEATIPKSATNTYTLTFYRNGTEFGSANVMMPEDFKVLEPNNAFNFNFTDALKVVIETKDEPNISIRAELRIQQGSTLLSESKGQTTVTLPPLKESLPDLAPPKEDQQVVLTVSRSRSQKFIGKFNGNLKASLSKRIYGKLNKSSN